MSLRCFHRPRGGESVAFPFLAVDGFLDDAACDRLAAYLQGNLGTQGATSEETFDHWAGRLIWESHVTDDWVRATMRDSAARIAALLQETYGTPQLHDDGVQLVRWPEGTAMPAHADNAFPGGEEHTTPWRDHAAILYLNDDFEDGQFYFAGAEPSCVIKPRKGLLVAFGGGFDYEHGVIAPRGCDRMTMASWYTSTPEARR